MLGINVDGVVEFNPDDFLTHGVVIGRTGSGKTGLITTLIEEVSSAGVSVIVIDPKGDLCNLALAPTSRQELGRVIIPGRDLDKEYSARVNGLAEFGLSHESVKAWVNRTTVHVYEPGACSAGAQLVNVFPDFSYKTCLPVVARELISREVHTLLTALGYSKKPYSPANVFLTEAVLLHWSYGRSCPVDTWSNLLLDPPEALHNIGGMFIDDFLPGRERVKLARLLVGFRYKAGRWLRGEKLDIDNIVNRRGIHVMMLRHLPEDDRQFFVTMLMNRVIEFMYSTAASQSLKLLVAIDEARGYLPPHPKNPATKSPICNLLAQGRAHGIGMLIGTQNPVDLDYKALSNCGTWFLGRLRERDCVRDLGNELASRGIEFESVVNLKTRNFIYINPRGDSSKLRVRWTYSYLRGPLTSQELAMLTDRRPLLRSTDSRPKDLTIRVSSPKKQRLPDRLTAAKRRRFWSRIFGW